MKLCKINNFLYIIILLLLLAIFLRVLNNKKIVEKFSNIWRLNSSGQLCNNNGECKNIGILNNNNQICNITGDCLSTQPSLEQSSSQPSPTKPTVPNTPISTEPTVPNTPIPTEPTVPNTPTPIEPTIPESLTKTFQINIKKPGRFFSVEKNGKISGDFESNITLTNENAIAKYESMFDFTFIETKSDDVPALSGIIGTIDINNDEIEEIVILNNDDEPGDVELIELS
jgi:hypothetical protein